MLTLSLVGLDDEPLLIDDNCREYRFLLHGIVGSVRLNHLCVFKGLTRGDTISRTPELLRLESLDLA